MLLIFPVDILNKTMIAKYIANHLLKIQNYFCTLLLCDRNFYIFALTWCCSGFWLWTWTCWRATWASTKGWVSMATPCAGVWGMIRWVVPGVRKGCCCSIKTERYSVRCQVFLCLSFLNTFQSLSYQKKIFIELFFFNVLVYRMNMKQIFLYLPDMLQSLP